MPVGTNLHSPDLLVS
eukprot:CCRYP_003843-RF/>CCRYP_003843-RF protein AED:0.48 eAED:1.00 QI:0/-1/0/1/-1/0/1/0/15